MRGAFDALILWRALDGQCFINVDVVGRVVMVGVGVGGSSDATTPELAL